MAGESTPTVNVKADISIPRDKPSEVPGTEPVTEYMLTNYDATVCTL